MVFAYFAWPVMSSSSPPAAPAPAAAAAKKRGRDDQPENDVHNDDKKTKTTSTMSADEFFASTTPPDLLNAVQTKITAFVATMPSDAKLVVVTSGGTIVPLEKNMVRFLDNFSTGRRGAASTEYFLKQGYYVVYLHRHGSVTPYARHVRHAFECTNFDFAFMRNARMDSTTGTIVLNDTARQALNEFAQVQHRLCVIEFTTLVDYLFYLRASAMLTASLRHRVVFYLAAAVSDFFIPQAQQTVHKIQSRAGPLELCLQPTPKLLGTLKRTWAPDALCFSFKLETDDSLLLPKARNAIANYGMDGVIANELHSRDRKITVVYPRAVVDIALDTTTSPLREIEELIVREIARAHTKYVDDSASSSS